MGKNYNILEEEQVPEVKKDSSDEEPPAYIPPTAPVLQDDFTRNEFLAADLNLDHNFSDTRIIHRPYTRVFRLHPGPYDFAYGFIIS